MASVPKTAPKTPLAEDPADIATTDFEARLKAEQKADKLQEALDTALAKHKQEIAEITKELIKYKTTSETQQGDFEQLISKYQQQIVLLQTTLDIEKNSKNNQRQTANRLLEQAQQQTQQQIKQLNKQLLETQQEMEKLTYHYQQQISSIEQKAKMAKMSQVNQRAHMNREFEAERKLHNDKVKILNDQLEAKNQEIERLSTIIKEEIAKRDKVSDDTQQHLNQIKHLQAELEQTHTSYQKQIKYLEEKKT